MGWASRNFDAEELAKDYQLTMSLKEVLGLLEQLSERLKSIGNDYLKDALERLS
ncbi:MAG: hypothetical protein F6J97_23050 [Leptolyngbya sp. SIO4C1]|nr:hypothetical protein [Leptolyngbya sp. SIO4C1]